MKSTLLLCTLLLLPQTPALALGKSNKPPYYKHHDKNKSRMDKHPPAHKIGQHPKPRVADLHPNAH